MADEQNENLVSDAAANPKRIKGDQGEVEFHSLPDLIETEKHLAAKKALKSPNRGFQIGKFRAGGATG